MGNVDVEPVPMHRREVLLAQARRMLAHHEAGTTDMAEAEYLAPVSTFTDQAAFERELEVVFRRSPLLAGLSCELAEPGAHSAFDVAGAPVVVTRGEDGRVRAMLNVCRHRGAEVASGRGCARRLACPYHAWVYDTEGTLVGMPGQEGFSGVDRGTHGLVQLPCEERHGLVWLVADPEGTLDLDAWLGPLDAELAELRLGELHHVETRQLPARANWHLAMDTNTESYHFGALHRDSIGPFTMGNLNVVDTFGDSQRLTFAACTLPELAASDEADWRPEQHLQFVYLLFPNNSLLVTGDHVELFRIMPGRRVDEQLTHQSYYARTPVEGPEAQLMAQAQFDMFHAVVRDEDFPCAESIQRGLASGANAHLTFGRNEPALHHLHRAQQRLLRE
jgi:phenylpropionate dioxygenase-like ring-hydroxylating dioxygenase large terminal subunit